jgi:hypothetical protein
MHRRLIGALALGALGCAPAAARQGAGGPPTPKTAGGAGSPAAAAAAAGAAGKTPLKPFAELTKDATARPGFFDTYEKEGRVYLAVPKGRLNENFLLSFQLAQGIGSRGIFGGTMMSLFEPAVVAMERHGDKIYLVQKPLHYRAETGSPTEKAVQLSFGTSVLDAAKVESVRPGVDSAAVIDVTDWLISDLSGIGDALRFAVATRPGTPGRASLDKTRSFVESVKSFPENTNLRAKLTFAPGEPVDIGSVPDSRFIPVSIHYTLAKLPAQPMKPRLGDDRMGYFMTVFKDFSRPDETFFTRYVNRWRLECGAPASAGALCTPKKPIVYYIDPNVPTEYRPAMMAGVNKWAKAFEAAGFKDAIRAELLPDSVDAEDIRYPTLRWNTSDEPGYGAIGPSIVDPRTGEILDADILFEANMVQGFRYDWGVRSTAAQAVNAMFATPVDEHGRELGEMAALGAELTAQGELLRTVLTAKGEINPNDPVPMEFVNQAITWVTMHEVGHTLGLRHNFRSSADTPLDKLHDAQWAEERGVFSSVMEYPTVNLAAAGKPNGAYYNPGAGSSDAWVISYGYTPDDARAKLIARDAAKPGHAYGTDEDARGAGAIDPTVNVFDLGADPLAWGKERATLIRSLWPELPKRALADDSRYARLTQGFQSLLNQYVAAVSTGVKYIGGQYQYRDHVGDPGGRPPFVAVPKAKQREALDFLNSYAFGEKSFDVPREVLAQFGANRWSHWGVNNTYAGRIDYPLAEQVLGAQRALLDQVMQPFVFARIRDAETKFGAAEVLTIPEYMGELTSAIWSEVYGGGARNVSANRRDLQRTYIDRMSTLVLDTPERMPADARSVGRQQLKELKRRIDATSGASVNAYTRAHLAESSARIGKVLEAELGAK